MFHIELIIEFLENVMNNIVQVAILFFEFVGVIVIILSGLKGFYNYVRRAGYEDHPGAGACCRAGIQVVQ